MRRFVFLFLFLAFALVRTDDVSASCGSSSFSVKKDDQTFLTIDSDTGSVNITQGPLIVASVDVGAQLSSTASSLTSLNSSLQSLSGQFNQFQTTTVNTFEGFAANVETILTNMTTITSTFALLQQNITALVASSSQLQQNLNDFSSEFEANLTVLISSVAQLQDNLTLFSSSIESNITDLSSFSQQLQDNVTALLSLADEIESNLTALSQMLVTNSLVAQEITVQNENAETINTTTITATDINIAPTPAMQSIAWASGWSNDPAFAVSLGYMKFGPFVAMQGWAYNGAGFTAGPSLITTLPVGFRPLAQKSFIVRSQQDCCGANLGPGYIVIETTGDVTAYHPSGSTTAPVRYCFDGVMFAL